MKKRHLEIIDILKQKPYMTIEDLCRALDVSPATMRRDLTQLEESGDILRINGGAMIKPQAGGGTQPDGRGKADPYEDEKLRIAQAAASLVKEGDTVFVDAGSTNQHIADRLAGKTNVTIITNSLEIAYRLNPVKEKQNLSVIICGGALGEANPDSIVGPVAEKMISMFRANLAFIGTSAIDIRQGITDAYLASARIKENMIENANKVYLVTDRSKFGVINTAFVCPIEQIDHVITDLEAPAEDIRYLQNRGIAVTLV
ncbi:transcriptional regulator, DeoR family [Paenibacillus sp. UNC496MF]|uniref:DeoR/GlpR family DNA-binding transcription regulator n=1 Tax=Paenibacillus sp. UNC496MF TaxID=1502753 RepID=UPI0008F383E9|nr:DeoR/GlpR family DNA-binding transcription regulator [Paenibacillus sp. UNC496MF]SFJ80443.1 transcriptional regulator, DeoR family [Paenibacillus sp. UNC496MF]